ncbi:MAG: class I SAM-dependent methyltransferase [Ruminococcaceae bacterium]|nr:class I SAM-dependent methyltransferase [Oscillospiraceae bacterium]
MYNDFAYLYDELINDVDYKKWVDYYFSIFQRYGINPQLGLDLGCGTGNMTTELCRRNVEMTGIDLSEDMLMVAREKSEGMDILYLNQDMCSFELYGTVDFIISSLDCMNYITDKRDLLKVMKLANNYLNPGGLFVFDINTRHKLENVIGNNTFILENDSVFCSWQNEYDKRRRICDFYLTFFCENDGVYTRFDEHHCERAYEIEEIKNLVEASGMRLLKVYDNLSFDKPVKNSERVFFVAQEQGKRV